MKIAGCFLIFFASIILSRNFTFSIKERAKELESFNYILNDFITAIEYGNYEIPSLIEEQTSKITSFTPIFIEVDKKLKEKKPLLFSTIWEEALSPKYFSLQPGQLKLITKFGEILSINDKERLLEQLKLFAEQTEEEMNKAKEEKKQKVTLIEKLGILCGIFLVILIL